MHLRKVGAKRCWAFDNPDKNRRTVVKIIQSAPAIDLRKVCIVNLKNKHQNVKEETVPERREEEYRKQGLKKGG